MRWAATWMSTANAKDPRHLADARGDSRSRASRVGGNAHKFVVD
jgi:hypothetical protein